MWPRKDLTGETTFSVDHFVETLLRKRFYDDSQNARATDRLFGARFGYGVLGRHYAMRDAARMLQSGLEEEAVS